MLKSDLWSQPFSEEEAIFCDLAKKWARDLLEPVPFFILSVSSIQHKNRVKLITLVDLMSSDKELQTRSGLNEKRLREILITAVAYETWYRGLWMTGQWFVQIFAIVIIWRILWSIMT